jgi:formylglycine-generating enzyme required for sulfatase activity
MFKKMDLTSKQMYSGNDGWEMTAPVGSVKGDKSPFGVMDLGGNVTEWVQDWYRIVIGHRMVRPKIALCAADRGTATIHRYARAPFRSRLSPMNRDFFGVGFRCARTK